MKPCRKYEELYGTSLFCLVYLKVLLLLMLLGKRLLELMTLVYKQGELLVNLLVYFYLIKKKLSSRLLSMYLKVYDMLLWSTQIVFYLLLVTDIHLNLAAITLKCVGATMGEKPPLTKKLPATITYNCNLFDLYCLLMVM